MSNGPDNLFLEMAYAKGYLDRARGEEAESIERATANDGENRRFLRDVLVEEGWMTREQVDEVDTHLDAGAEKTGKIEGYKLLAKIGQGGMGAVYKAQHDQNKEIVALKVLPGRMAKRGDFVERFLREARAATKLVSDHIVRPIDVGFSGGYYYFAMEFVDGESVDTTLSIDGVLSESRAVPIIHQMAIALRDAEKAGMVHRDIKPGNILVTPEGDAKLTDFGLAREVDDHSMTQTGMTLGTPNYMSPEQAKAMKSLDIRSDIYSLGVTFYHMVTGSPPFQGETSLLTMLKHLNEAPVAPISRRPELSQACNDIILKMMAKDRDERYRSPDELITDLDRLMKGEAPRYARPPTAPAQPAGDVPEDIERFAQQIRRQGRMSWLKLGIGAFVIALVAFVAWEGFLSGDDGGVVTPANGNTGRLPPSADRARAERLARSELAQARRFAAENPDQLYQIVQQYRTVERRHATTTTFNEAHQLRVAAEGAFRKAVQAAFARTRSAADALARNDRFGDAIQEYDRFPEPLITRDVSERLETARQVLRDRAWERFRELEQKANTYLKMEKLVAARMTIEPALQFGISGIATRTRERLAEIEALRSGAASAESQAQAAYRATTARIRRLVRSGAFAKAEAQLDAEFGRAPNAEVRTLLDQGRATLRTAKIVWKAALAGLDALKPGDAFVIGAMPTQVKKVFPGRGRVRVVMPGGRELTLSIGWFPADTLRKLAVSGDATVNASHLTAFFLARGDIGQATAELKRARAADPRSGAVARYAKQLDILRRAGPDVEAENLFNRAHEQAAGGQFEQAARTLWDLVARFGETTFFKDQRTEIEGLLLRAESESITADTLFVVPPATADGVTTLKYDFGDLAQSRAWPTVWDKRSRGRWPIDEVEGEMTAESGLVYFLVPLRRDLRVRVRVRDVRAASIRLGLPEPTAAPQAAGLSFVWRMVEGGAETELRHKGKTIDRVRKHPAFTVVGALELGVEIQDGALTVSMAGRPVQRLTARENPLVAEQAGYLVLDGFNAGARVTEVEIRSSFDRERLQKQFVEPLRAAKQEQAKLRLADYRTLLVGDTAEGWRAVPPTQKWQIAGGYARAPRGAKCALTTGELTWKDYVFAAKVQLDTRPGSAQLLVRWTDPAEAGRTGKGYAIDFSAGAGAGGAGGTITLTRSLGDRLETIKQANVALTAMEWHPVHVQIRGSTLRVLFDGREVLRAEDRTYAAGRVGIGSFQNGARFHDVKIKLLDEPPLDDK
jgi:serine/threonine-protein kinase